MTKMFNIANYVVRDSDNAVDQEASLRRFQSDMQAVVANESDDVDTISAAVNAVFDRHVGATIKTDALIRATLTEMKVDVNDDARMTVRTRRLLQKNTSDRREDGCMFRCSKGAGGGVCRWSEYADKPAKTAKKAK